MNGITSLINGAFFQVGRVNNGGCIRGFGYAVHSPVPAGKQQVIDINAGIVRVELKKLPALSKKDKANGLKKIEQVAKKGNSVDQKKNFLKCL